MNDPADAALRRLSDEERLSWLRLIRSENVGPSTFVELIRRFGSAEAALETLPSLARRGGSGSFSISSLSDAERELERASKFGARFVAVDEPDYPAAMRAMDHPPPLIAVKGDADALRRPAVGIVGSRNASLTGAKIARSMAADLGKSGYDVASGLARGIDTAAHNGALEAGTVAVLAGSLDEPYPKQNVSLFDAITNGCGAAISEMPFGWELRARDFPRRNRIIAGLALGVVVVEAAQRSGSLITARLAAEYGRLVFAVPGSPLDPRAAGTNRLLREGATLAGSAADIKEQLTPLAGIRPNIAEPEALASEAEPLAAPQDPDRDRVVELLSPTPTSIDEIIRHSGLEPAQVSAILLELDLAGRIERHAGDSVSLLS